MGIGQFLDRHKDDGLTQRIAATLTIEHLGALEWLRDSNGYLHPTGRFEPAALFVPRTPALAGAAYATLKHADAAPAFMLLSSNLWDDGRSKKAPWPGAGPHFRGRSAKPWA
ncbi:hypothetical protein [Janthinobacterium sp. MDB2-8]|uniref:hypothetical protein n=1 Tax=Janthinobacterium sp. MDB2-8 TaxID=1259338 RepID=UPI003F1EAF69